MQSDRSQVHKVGSTGWYVETRTGFDGPFESEKEAIDFFYLLYHEIPRLYGLLFSSRSVI